jgi:post-segregation antitoxin (ccd killing protein)
MTPMKEPTQKYSVTMPRDIAEAARARSGPSGLSAYVTAAVARQLERDKLNELIEASEAENGPADTTAVEEKRAVFAQARTRKRDEVA